MGLLILPQQHWYDNIPETLLMEKDWGISPENIILNGNEESKNVRNIVRHLRNSISHYHFHAFNNHNEKISEVKFEDYDLNNNKTFEATLPVESITNFLHIFSEYMLNFMDSSIQRNKIN